VRKHTSKDSLWVTYKGGVYDVTKFVGIHPGGEDLLLSAGGLDLGPFWETYLVHLYKATTPVLAQMGRGCLVCERIRVSC